MVLYNVGTKFFPLKGAAEVFRKEAGLPPEALHKLDIKNSVHLTEFLNELCSLEKTPEFAVSDEDHVAASIVVSQEAIPDFIPIFLQKDWK